MGVRVAIFGSSGFVGSALIRRLAQEKGIDAIRGLSRSGSPASEGKVEGRKCDLFSLLDAERGLEGIDEAIYLIHSMLPSSELAQGSFEDYDLLLADNFVRACRKNGVRRILYLSGIIPHALEKTPELLSRHLASRLEVEKVLRSSGLPLLVLRAGIVLGSGGSSFEMLVRLVERLPMMVCPAWARSKSNPIHIDDVAESFRYALEKSDLTGCFDLAGPETLTYVDMIRKTAEGLGKERRILNFSGVTPGLSKLWVNLVSGAPKNLVYPLIDSLVHDMRADHENVLRLPGWNYRRFDEALAEFRRERDAHPDSDAPKAYRRVPADDQRGVVQSVQRLKLPEGRDANWASLEYVTWLNRNFNGVINVKTAGEVTRFYLASTQEFLLELTRSPERSAPDRVLFYITGGRLAEKTKRGRLEFRVAPDGKTLIVAIHDFRPKLPWYLYKYSQAPFHAHVMRAFGRHLEKIERKS